MQEELFDQFKSIVLQDKWLMGVLKSARAANLPDWFLAGGVIRNTVWDYLHNYTIRTPIKDVDLIFFDSRDLSSEREKKSEEILKSNLNDVNWEVVNQARIHTLYPPFPSVCSSEEAIRYFSEEANCIGIRLEADDSPTICAP